MGDARSRRSSTVSVIRKGLDNHEYNFSSDRFFMAELSWNTAKVDELLLPIIHKMNRRNQVNCMTITFFS